MPEWVAGKIFHTPEEVRELGLPTLTEEQIAEANRQFDEWEAARDAARAAGTDSVVPTGGRFSDDLVGTEYDPDARGYPEHKRRTFNPRETRDE